MARAVIRVDGLGKQYRIGARREGYRSLRETLSEVVTAPFRRAAAVLRGRPLDAGGEAIWALRDLSFEVEPGEVVGVIGRNGAGKSTLLKLLSRITRPTEGRVALRGRVGSLLEVGTAFHPELSGRDNVYLNGAILGMGRVEIDRKFDAIVDFAGIERFIDTPVKHYSSGMYMRLAFGVAAHLEPDILVVDEVLAVGDVAFQKKCLRRMEDVSRSGRTVLFVSHNMQAVRALCPRCVLLRQGRVIADGPASAVVSRYQEEAREAEIGARTGLSDAKLRRGSGEARFTHVSVEDATGARRFDFRVGETVRLRMRYEVFEPVRNLYFFLIVRAAETDITSIRHVLSPAALPAGKRGELLVELPRLELRPNEYTLCLYLNDDRLYPYDTLDGMTGPLVISTDRSLDELGYVASNPSGFFSLPSRLVSHA